MYSSIGTSRMQDAGFTVKVTDLTRIEATTSADTPPPESPQALPSPLGL